VEFLAEESFAREEAGFARWMEGEEGRREGGEEMVREILGKAKGAKL